jgi:hypothetical protein
MLGAAMREWRFGASVLHVPVRHQTLEEYREQVGERQRCRRHADDLPTIELDKTPNLMRQGPPEIWFGIVVIR